MSNDNGVVTASDELDDTAGTERAVRRRGTPLAAVTLLVAAAVCGACGQTDASPSSRHPVVPDLHGETLREATCQLQSL